jgi:hypothetical protein
LFASRSAINNPKNSAEVTQIRSTSGILHLSAGDTDRGIAGLVSPFANAHLPAAIWKHLRHEWQLIQPTVGVQFT